MTITNYNLSEFLQLSDVDVINEYLTILELLPPAENVKKVESLTFGEVNQLGDLMNEGTVDSIIKAVSILSETAIDEVADMTIIDFWGVRNKIEKELLELIEREKNYLYSDESDPIMLEVNAGQRLSKFGVLNTLDNLANGDITKYKAIEDLPYLLVFAKLLRDKEVSEINKDIADIQKRKQKN